MPRFVWLSFVLGLSLIPPAGCAKAHASKPNCEKMRACCAALKGVENGLPQEHEILCHHNPELDEGCVETIADIAKFTPSKNLPPQCK
jgi:hypothetical protein